MSTPSTPQPAVVQSIESKTDKDSSQSSLGPLLSADGNEILDLIDNLRHTLLDKYNIALPRIVVCGDQSVGKSSVLEALSKFNFPRSNKQCTRFATELSLRHGKKNKPEGKILWKNTNDTDKILVESDVEKGLAKIIDEAEKQMKERHRNKQCSFFEDVLQISASDPSWPAVTLVDLPGIVVSTGNARDEAVSKSIIERYIQEKETIILAIVQAPSDPEIQAILKLAKKHDPEGIRTIAVITKPDRINDTDTEDIWLPMAQNKSDTYRFKYDWHVVKNRSSEELAMPISDWDENERRYFSGSVWEKRLASNQLGTSALHAKLSKVLEEKARLALPHIMAELKDKLTKCEQQLENLGPARLESSEQRIYLLDIGRQFQNIVTYGSHGLYHLNQFFSTDATKLRKLIRDQNDIFIRNMYGWGHTYEIEGSDSNQWRTTEDYLDLEGVKDNLDPPERLSREQMLLKINEIAAQNRGLEFDGATNLNNFSCVFSKQSARWDLIARDHILRVLDITLTFLLGVLRHVVGKEHTAQILEIEIIKPLMDRKRKEVAAKCDEILRPYKELASFSYNPGLRERTRNVYRKSRTDETERRKEYNMDRSSRLHSAPEPQVKDSIEGFEGEYIEYNSTDSKILDVVQAHYEVRDCYLLTILILINTDLSKLSIASFTFNTAALVVENCLLHNISEILTPREILTMAPEKIAHLTSEPGSIADERRQKTRERKDLKEALEKCEEKLGGEYVFATLTASNLTPPKMAEYRHQRTTPILSPSSSSSSTSSSTAYSEQTNVATPSISQSPGAQAIRKLKLRASPPRFTLRTASTEEEL
jgi:GTP-binding protein EngB required for normal cell division